MNGLQFRRRESRHLVALVHLELVRDAEFLEQPEDALRARGFEVMNGQHRTCLAHLTSLITPQASRVPPAQPFLSSDSSSQYVSGWVCTTMALPSASKTLRRPGESVMRLVVCLNVPTPFFTSRLIRSPMWNG